MPLQIYKPNKSNTGHAVSFSFNSKDGAYYLEFIKQTGVGDGKPGSGTFKGGERANVKFSHWECGNILMALQANDLNSSWNTVHKSNDRSVKIQVGAYDLAAKAAGVIAGYGISVTVTDSANSSGKKFSIGLTPGERVTVTEHIKFFLDHYFTSIYSEDKKKNAEYLAKKDAEKGGKQNNTQAPAAEVVTEKLQDADTQSDDAPF